jgi:uncharacterized membrane protein (DUF106 family)
MLDFFTLTLIMPINVATAAIMIGFAYAILTLKVQRRLTNPQKTKEIQAKIQSLTKEMNEMSKRKEDITAKQAEIMPLFQQSMKLQMKSMFVILPVFFLIYYGLLPLAFSAFASAYFTIYAIPFTYGTLFIGSAVIASLIINIAIMLRDKAAAKKLKQAAQTANPNSGTDTSNAK